MAAFLASFDGADLFHEMIVLAGVTDGAAASLVSLNHSERPEKALDTDLVIGHSAGGDHFVLAAPEERVFRLRPGSDERWLAGTDFPHWLEATVAAEQLLYDAEGEFLLDVFESDGEELVPIFAARQAERALRKDPGAAERLFDLGGAQRRLGKLPQAAASFAQAAELDPANPWPWFDLGRARLELGQAHEAAQAFHRAAEGTPGREGGRMLGWAARALLAGGAPSEAARAADQALQRDPDLVTGLRAAKEAATDVDQDSADEAERMLEVFAPAVPLRHRLPLAQAPRETPPPPAATRQRPPRRR